jgi:arylamine N-acetyltransferase
VRALNAPVLEDELVDRVLSKLGLDDRPTIDLAGLNAVYAAFCTAVPDDNIQKRIWFASNQSTPVTGGDPVVFFENWLAHGTGGTCWPINGALCTLLHSIGFDARRNAGRMVLEEYPGTNHGSVVTTLGGIEYLVDAQVPAMQALRLSAEEPQVTESVLYYVAVEPCRDSVYDVAFYPAVKRETKFTFRTEPENDTVDHAFFVDAYERSKRSSPFNDALYFCCRRPTSILALFRSLRIDIALDNTVTQSEVADDERKRILVEEVGISEEAVDALPPDVPEGRSL